MDEGDTFTRRATVSEAAELLGITPDAVRKRVERDKIMYERDDSGRLFVWVDPSEIKPDKSRDTSEAMLISRLEEEVRFLREELARKDAILLRMAESIPQLEAPERPQEAPESPDPTETSTGATGGQEAERESEELRRRLEAAREVGGSPRTVLERGNGAEGRPREGSREQRERAGQVYWWLIASLVLGLAAAVAVIAFFVVMGLLA